ncbi:MAG: shikimate dehydrogenase [Alphaproteobacteria bacterium]|nr:shikimate dehydrogenase [Alphaproteobacteria bacterium]
MIDGRTQLIAHIGFPTHTFKSPLIYNPYFERAGIPAVVVPMACRADAFGQFLPAVFGLDNIAGALITMPHKISVVDLLDEVTPTVRMAGSCNAVKKSPEGRLLGDMFDGIGFVRGLQRQGFEFSDQSALIIGAGGVGSAIAASLAQTGLAEIHLVDIDTRAAETLANRLRAHVPHLKVHCGRNDPTRHDLIVNASPLGMRPGEPAPTDLSRLPPGAWVAEVVLSASPTPLMLRARELGCPLLVGTDMLFEQIPAYLEFFGLPTTTADHLRAVARLSDTDGVSR